MSAPAIEDAVLARIKNAAANPEVLSATLARLNDDVAAKCSELERERDQLKKQLDQLGRELAQTTKAFRSTAPDLIADRLADLQDRIGTAERRLTAVQHEIQTLRSDVIDDGAVAVALAEFIRVWEFLTLKEQVRMVSTIVEKVGYDGESGKVTVAFRAAGIRELCRRAESEN